MGWVLVLLAGLCTFVPMEKDPHSQHDMPRTDATQFNTSAHNSRLPDTADDQGRKQPDTPDPADGLAHAAAAANAASPISDSGVSLPHSASDRPTALDPQAPERSHFFGFSTAGAIAGVSATDGGIRSYGVQAKPSDSSYVAFSPSPAVARTQPDPPLWRSDARP